ncbi:Immunoglobulin-binding protein 1, partial [Paragonimus heterotremus]
EQTTSAVHNREAKIKRYKEKKDLEENLKRLAIYVEQPHVDDEVKRDYHSTLIRFWICLVKDELPTLKQEEQLLSLSPEQLQGKKEPVTKPMKPFIITRDAIQAAVFGAGYPSLPTMSLDELCTHQVQKGIFPSPKPISTDKVPSVRRIDPSETEKEAAEKKAAEEDALEDADDPQRLLKARQWDEFKDETRKVEISTVCHADVTYNSVGVFIHTSEVMPRKASVQYIQNSEPSFIRKFKEHAGIPCEPTIDSKRTELHKNSDDGDRPDEQPQLVWDPSSGVSESEARTFLEQRTLKDNEDATTDVSKSEVHPFGPHNHVPDNTDHHTTEPGKIIFRPKHSKEQQVLRRKSDLITSSSRSKDSLESRRRDRSPLQNQEAIGSGQGKLSFNFDEEDK